jgi:hypothetical protein
MIYKRILSLLGHHTGEVVTHVCVTQSMRNEESVIDCRSAIGSEGSEDATLDLPDYLELILKQVVCLSVESVKLHKTHGIP